MQKVYSSTPASCVCLDVVSPRSQLGPIPIPVPRPGHDPTGPPLQHRHWVWVNQKSFLLRGNGRPCQPGSPPSNTPPSAPAVVWLPSVMPGAWGLWLQLGGCTVQLSMWFHTPSRGSLTPGVLSQCSAGDSTAAALNGTPRGAGRHSGGKSCGLGGLRGALGFLFPVLSTPWPTQEHAQPIWLQQHRGEKTCAATEPAQPPATI